jgi:Rps23 Pro-64 3,4-dihydroxylase Tpa1-like proline 4-hydroxylase
MSSPVESRLSEISAPVRLAVDQYREAFVTAQPFKHVTIENFFEPAFAEQLLAEFPSFDVKLSTNESGHASGKSVNTNIRSISPAYQRLYETLAARPFLDFVSQLSGIPDLLLDPKMFGGGTHENLHGQELDPHVDFNYDESRQLHRRLNLIVYLNKEWQSEWGGAIEIHSNPRRPFENQIRGFDPLFNRCVMFETNEYSWHGFPRIQLPEDKRHLSRKSISIYLYTTERPAEEIAPVHATFYVQRPLPSNIVAGHTLTEGEAAELQSLIIRRDGWIEMYQKMELEKNRDLAELAAHIEVLRRRIRAPLTGYLLAEGHAEGLHGDGWASSRVHLKVRPLMPVTGFQLRGFRPPSAPEAKVRILLNGATAAEAVLSGPFAIGVTPPEQQDVFEFEILCDSEQGWAKAAGDDRDLAFILVELRALHPGCPEPA